MSPHHLSAHLLDGEKLAVLDDLVDESTCNAITDELQYTLWRPSQVVLRRAHGELESTHTDRRRSMSTDAQWFGPQLNSMLDTVAEQLCSHAGTQRSHLERWQAIDYQPGAYFDLHHDAGTFDDESAGEREITLLVHLQTPAAGGATVFPRLNQRVAAVTGRVLLWRNLVDGRPDPDMLHAAEPVKRGRKLILTTWARQRPFPPTTAAK